jgi:putative ABC transport system ATP-binding protein
VDNLSLSIVRGEFVAIVGSSGSGKSTVLNLLAGLDTPTSGRIVVDGLALDGLSRRQLAQYRARRIGMVFQAFNLLGHYTALGNVRMALYFDGTPHETRDSRAQAMLERVGLGDRLEHHPPDLSGGEQQRVAIARALVRQPDILFADEPTGNLDAANSRQVLQLLRDLHARGLTVILVTHDRELAEEYADRIIRMHYGEMVEQIILRRGEGDHDLP